MSAGRGGDADGQRLEGRARGQPPPARSPEPAAGECGAGIKAGEGISFNVDYESGVVAVQDEMNDLAAQAKKVGIDVDAHDAPIRDRDRRRRWRANRHSPTCKWTAENWGAGWIYGPDYLPTGEPLYAPGAVANYGSYDDPTTTRLIRRDDHGPGVRRDSRR